MLSNIGVWCKWQVIARMIPFYRKWILWILVIIFWGWKWRKIFPASTYLRRALRTRLVESNFIGDIFRLTVDSWQILFLYRVLYYYETPNIVSILSFFHHQWKAILVWIVTMIAQPVWIRPCRGDCFVWYSPLYYLFSIVCPCK